MVLDGIFSDGLLPYCVDDKALPSTRLILRRFPSIEELIRRLALKSFSVFINLDAVIGLFMPLFIEEPGIMSLALLVMNRPPSA